MSSVITSRRYASALLSAAEEGNFLQQIVEELQVIKVVLEHFFKAGCQKKTCRASA